MCERADSWDKDESDIEVRDYKFIELTPQEKEQAVFYKMSLGDSTIEDDKEIFNYCISENKISIGKGGMIDISKFDSEEEIVDDGAYFWIEAGEVEYHKEKS